MQIVNLEETKKICLNILVQFDQLCKKNGLHYSLAYGTLIGAIRHNGFIPWDDDIDVIMQRDDYERFLNLGSFREEQNNYGIIHYKMGSRYFYPYAKMFDRRTCLEENGMKNNLFGVYIDIFPIDSAGKTLASAMKNKTKCKKLEKYVLVSMKDTKNTTNLLRKLWYSLIKIIPGKIYCDKIEKIALKNKSDHHNFLTNMVWGYDAKKEVGAIRNWGDFSLKSFEGYSFDVLSEYDYFLKKVYGNYMELPAEEKRVSHHSTITYMK